MKHGHSEMPAATFSRTMKQVAETGNGPGGPIVFEGLFDQHEEETDQVAKKPDVSGR